MMKKCLFFIFIFLFLFAINIVYAYDEYEVGDVINYKGITFHVIKDSDSNQSYVLALKDNPLTSYEISKYSHINGNQDSVATISFGSTLEGCKNVDAQYTCTSSYDETVMKKIIDYWLENEIGNDNVVDVDGYKSRLLNESDLSNLGYSVDDDCVSYSYRVTYSFNEKNGNVTDTPYYECSSGKCYLVFNAHLSSENYQGVLHSCYSVPGNSVDSMNKDNFDQYLINNEYNISLCGGYGFGTVIGMTGDFFDINYDIISKSCQMHSGETNILTSNFEYSWLNYENYSFWTMAQQKFYGYPFGYLPDSNRFATPSHGVGPKRYENLSIRPVVNFKKSQLGDKQNYELGDQIDFNGEKYYVVENSNVSKNYVAALKYKPLMQSSVNGYLYQEASSFVPYYYQAEGCSSLNDSAECKIDYNDSNVKKIIDNWAENTFYDGDLVKKLGYKARLLSVIELLYDLGYYNPVGSTVNIYATGDTPSWVYEGIDYYWIMPYDISDSTELRALRTTNNVVSSNVYETALVRPVVNLRKCAINGNECPHCEEGTPKYEKKLVYQSYNISDIVTYNGDSYYVIGGILDTDSYVTLLKADPLSFYDLEKYGKDDNDDFFINKYSHRDENRLLVSKDISYYTSENCGIEYEHSPYTREIGRNKDGCVNSFENSDVKKVLDNWANDKLNSNDLVGVNGYKVRLINEDDLLNHLSFTKSVSDGITSYESHINYIFLDQQNIWTMISGDNNYSDFIIMNYLYSNKIGDHGRISQIEVYDKAQINPVINVKKCALEDGCYETDILLECESNIIPDDSAPDPDQNVVEVDNTLKIISRITLSVSVLLIIAGLCLLVLPSLKRGYNNK